MTSPSITKSSSAGLAVVVDMRDREGHTGWSELAVDERERRGVIAPGAVDASYGGASNRELVDTRRPIGFCFPASAIVVGILSKCGGTEFQNSADEQRQFHGGALYPAKSAARFIASFDKTGV